jgi:hypothetical protein
MTDLALVILALTVLISTLNSIFEVGGLRGVPKNTPRLSSYSLLTHLSFDYP